MPEICPTCGLPNDICVCSTIQATQQLVTIRVEARKWGKLSTIIDGLQMKNDGLKELGSKLKTGCACGGTAKDGLILLQGDHRERAKKILVETGIPEKSIEIH